MPTASASVRNVSFVAAACIASSVLLAAAQDADWVAYGRDAGGERFSPLTGIRPDNVASLKVAWTYRTGDAYSPKEGRPTAHEATPLHLDDTLFLNTPLGRVIALDPVSGVERWRFDAKSPRDEGWGDNASRGVSAWRRGDDRRIFVATIDARQFVVVSAGGHAVEGAAPLGDYVVAFALPPG